MKSNFFSTNRELHLQSPLVACISAHFILSPFLPLLFSIFLLFPYKSSAIDQIIKKNQCSSKDTAVLSHSKSYDGQYSTVIGTNGGWRMPLQHSAENWQPFAFGGLSLRLPTYIHRLSIRFGLQSGVIKAKPPHDSEILMFHFTAACLYSFPVFSDRFELSPLIALSQTTIYLREKFKLINIHLFGDSESEFGTLAGVEPSIIFDRLRISFPLYLEYVFAAPNAFFSFSVSGNIGVTF